MYLIDTHAYLWFLTDDPRLPNKAKETIERTEGLYISIGSFWEMAIKSNIGKLKLPASISKMMADCEDLKIEILPISPAHLERIETMPGFHGDPFDRLILSQAMVEDFTILSTDGKFDLYNVRTLWK